MKTKEQWLAESITKGQANIDSGYHQTGVSSKELKVLLTENGFEKTDHRKIFYRDIDLPNPSAKEIELNNYKDEGKGVAITCYIVGSELDEQAWGVFINFCKVKDLTPMVIPVKYRNPTSLEEALSQEDSQSYLDPRVLRYLQTDRVEIHGVTILADIRPQLTATDPLSSVSALSRGKSAILPHPTHSIYSIPRMYPSPPVMQYTTGMISKPVFGHHLAAKKAEFHAVTGWAVVTKHNAGEQSLVPIVRLVHCKKYKAYDLGQVYDQGSALACPPLFSFWGDSHFGQEDTLAHQWASDVCQWLGVRRVFLNDTFDGSTINHHDKDPSSKRRIFNTLWDEVKYHNSKINELQSKFKISIMDSNHNQWMIRWLTDVHPVHDIDNKADRELYAMLLSEINPLQGAVFSSGAQPLNSNYRLFHGHETCNGGKMTHKTLSKLGNKTAYGHTHTPLQFQGVHNPGCLCRIDQDYTVGSLTSWAHGVSVVYENDVCQLLIKPE